MTLRLKHARFGGHPATTTPKVVYRGRVITVYHSSQDFRSPAGAWVQITKSEDWRLWSDPLEALVSPSQFLGTSRGP